MEEAGVVGGGDLVPVLVITVPHRSSEWLIEKHGTKKRRSWKKLHIGVDAASGRRVAATLTDRASDDAAHVGPLLDQVSGPVAALTGDGTYDRSGVYARGRRAVWAAHRSPPKDEVCLYVSPPTPGKMAQRLTEPG